MLILSIPTNELVGTCRINGQQAEYRVLPNHLEFRYEGQEMWDRRRILDSSENGDLTQLTCDNGAGSEGAYCVIRPVAVPTSGDHFYWLAINGASCAASSVPLSLTVRVIPTPEQLIGFRTRDAQIAAQQFLLTAPISEVDTFMKNELPRKSETGEVVYIRPEFPEPPTTGPTHWESGSSDGNGQGSVANDTEVT